MTRPADDIKAGSQAGRSADNLHNIGKMLHCLPVRKITVKNTVSDAINHQKKPTAKKHVSNHIKKRQKTSIYK